MKVHRPDNRDVILAVGHQHEWRPQVGLVRRWEFWAALALCAAFWIVVVV